MMQACVLDASVAVASVRPGELTHVLARTWMEQFLIENQPFVVPSFFDAEFVSALVRRGTPFNSAASALARLPLQRVVIGPRAIQGVLEVIAATRLRAADATYVWLAKRKKLPLATLDGEVVARAAWVGVMTIRG